MDKFFCDLSFYYIGSLINVSVQKYLCDFLIYLSTPAITYAQRIKIRISLGFLGHKSSISDSETFLIKRIEVMKG